MRLVKIWNASNEQLIGDRIEIAETSFARMRGLLGRKSLDEGEGLWISPSSGVHTVGMSFAIDVLGMDKDLRVVRIWERLAPWRATSLSLRTHSVIELPAGRIAEVPVRVGDRLRIELRV
ncbi:MAG: DUF192 domain-containing protein [Acidobacterium ailaaui]|nr:DUF192 domain-containing protein [Pseudacidobacterium ailaaui]